jgi:TPR repeat protein
MIKLLRTTAFLLCTAVPVMAQDLDKGIDAFEAGDYDAALQEWRPLAEHGNAEAQAYLGDMYRHGTGVIQDVVIAHMWTNIGSANGFIGGSWLRDEIEERMTNQQVAEAQALARRCMASDYQDCG